MKIGISHLIALLLSVQIVAISCVTKSPQRNNEDSNGLHFLIEGHGEAVVLVHGFSQTHEAWLQTPLYQDLVRDHQLIAVDLRGHGKSPKPYDPQDYGTNLQADLVAVLDQLHIDKAHFIGFSLGANVVGDLLILNRDRVQTATMGSGFFTRWNEQEEAFAQETEKQDGRELRPWEPENQDFRALAAVIRGLKNSAATTDQIASITTPTLITFGSIEVGHMNDSEKRQLSKLPDSVRVKIIEGADHDSDRAAVLTSEFSEFAREFINSNPIH